MKQNKTLKKYSNYIMPTYTRTPLVIVKGKGKYVWDKTGKRYLDFFPGWAVSALGHCHPRVVSRVSKQLKNIIHVSNNYYHPLQAELAEKIVKSSFKGKVFFANSGAEAIESVIKLARKYGYPKRHEIISMYNSFHGRTLAAITLTGQRKYQKGFKPLPSGFKYVPFNDIKAIKKAVTKKTIAVVVEPIQGEGGVNVASKKYLKELRTLCDQKDILLVFDEIQTGMGRSGKMFCFEHYGVKPDIMTLAKTLGGGFPIAAVVASSRVADVLQPGTHASTFGGSPIVCAAALGVFEAIEKDKLLTNVNRMGKYLVKKLQSLKKKYPAVIAGIKGKGLMLGIELRCAGSSIVDSCMQKGLLINCTQGNILRLLPPLNIGKSDIDKAIRVIEEAIEEQAVA